MVLKNDNSRKIIIELQNVEKDYFINKSKIEVLKKVNFKVFKGEFLSIMGKSGSGKTTIVNQIGCLDIPTSGKVILSGIDTKKISESKLAILRGKKIGYVFQKFNLIKNLSAIENVTLPMIFQNIPKNKRVKKAKELLIKFDMGEVLNNKPGELSGGQQQRVAIARALANEPEIILADEPTGNLDSKNGIIVMEFLKNLHKEGKTIILVTHDSKIAHYGQRIITLSDGKVILEEENKNVL